MKKSEPTIDEGSQIGTIGGKYVMHRLLGAGGMGNVYEAENLWTRRRVAIKLMRPELADSDDAVQRFVEEAQNTSRIEHPNIVDVLDMGRDPDRKALFIVEEYLEGYDLRQRLRRSGPLAPHEAVAILAPVMRALVVAHARGVVHRDIKPEHIYLAQLPSGEQMPKLIDFGIAKVIGGRVNRAVTQTGYAMGTPHYMSPEQVRGDADIDARTDVWSMGVVLYELLTGQCPYAAPSYELLVVKLLTGRAPRIETLVPDLPVGLADVVHMALEPERSQRFANMEAFLDALTQLALPGVGPEAPSWFVREATPPRGHVRFDEALTLPVETAPADPQATTRRVLGTRMMPGERAVTSRSRSRWLLALSIATPIVAAAAVVLAVRHAAPPAPSTTASAHAKPRAHVAPAKVLPLPLAPAPPARPSVPSVRMAAVAARRTGEAASGAAATSAAPAAIPTESDASPAPVVTPAASRSLRPELIPTFD